MEIPIITNKTVSFIGYVPQNSSDDGTIKDLEQALSFAISESIKDGFNTFLVGISDSFDVYSVCEFIKQKSNNPNIKIIAVISLDKGSTSLDQYNYIKSNADEIINLSDNKNEYLINNSSRLICYYDGRHSDTENALEYARQKEIQIVNIAPKDINSLHTFDNVTDIVRDDLERTIKKK